MPQRPWLDPVPFLEDKPQCNDKKQLLSCLRSIAGLHMGKNEVILKSVKHKFIATVTAPDLKLKLILSDLYLTISLFCCYSSINIAGTLLKKDRGPGLDLCRLQIRTLY